jgi:1,4-dihydroxy-2-naphthoate polyprenyltransferase
MTPWLLAARPKTLSASVVPVLVGTALAHPLIHWPSFGCALLGAVFIQIGTNLVNDAIDFRRGADTAARVGPLRVTQAGLLTANTVLLGAYICFTLAAICGIPLIVRGGWPIVIVGVTSIAAAYAYTGGPYPLAYHGLGELFVLIFFGFVAVVGSYYVQRLTTERAAWIAGFAVGCLAVALLAVNNLRDVEADRASMKRTLAVRLGERFAFLEIGVCVLAAFASVVAIASSRGAWLLLPLLALPLGVALIMRVRHSRGTDLNRCLALAGALQWAFGILFVVGCLL